MNTERQTMATPMETSGSGELLAAFYGDDFTGSTDAMEALAKAGIRTVLFLKPPRAEELAAFKGLRAFGVAGASRTLSPVEMEAELRPTFAKLKEAGAPLIHYKVCSTFDSSPEVGSIGRAIDIGHGVFGGSCVPVLVGAPVLGRFTVFGNLFARSGLDSEPFRLDRHPTMSRHPVTPMNESDVRLILQHQTARPVHLIDVLRVEDGSAGEAWAQVQSADGPVVLLDVLYPRHLPILGRLIWNEAARSGPLFIVGSSGVEYALTAHWCGMGMASALEERPPIESVDSLVVVSGSCSPVTERQIQWALDRGFAEVPLNSERLIDPDERDAEIARASAAASVPLGQGQSVILHTCRGPDDPRLQSTHARLAEVANRTGDRIQSAKVLGQALGVLLGGLLSSTGLRRAVVTGGDTSSYAARALGIEALETLGSVAPGCPLCRAYGRKEIDGLEIAFKGGQVGKADVMGRASGGKYD